MESLGVLLSRAVDVLRAGGLVAFPTETVYGLGANAEDPIAVRRIYAVKGRPTSHPLIVHLADPKRIADWAAEVPSVAWKLGERFWPGPLTLILRRGPRASDFVTGGQDTIGLRVPAHPIALAMLRDFGGGVAAPSANRYGAVSPTTAAHVREDLGGDVDCILDGGPSNVGIESTIVDVTAPEPRILRPGGVSREDLEGTLGRPVALALHEESPIRAPGQHALHYAPCAEVVVAGAGEIPERAALFAARSLRVMVVSDVDAALLPANTVVVRPPPDAGDWARALYATLRQADIAGFDVVLVSLPEEKGLGLAIADRLRRAAGPRKR